MKPMNQTGKTSGSFNAKSKKTPKDREKRKSQNSVENNANDKGSPTKDHKQYAGISSDFLNIHDEFLSEEVRETLAEDINYRLRHIIHDALIKARLSGRCVINHKDIDETFKNLSIEKVYGATSTPNWVPLAEHNILYLDDAKINLIELAEEENRYAQYGDLTLVKRWLPDPELDNVSPALKNYFTTFCNAIVNNDDELRWAALKDISENPQIGPIMEWFYHFSYFLLLKDITYDCLTLHALNLIETLENSPLGSQNVSEKQLNLLVRLLLQRLLISNPNKDIVKPMCSVLALLCLRCPLREMAITKLNQKLPGIQAGNTLPLLTAIYFLGIEAVKQIFLPNINYFLQCICDEGCPDMIYMTQAIYSLICKACCGDEYIHGRFYITFNYMLLPFWKQDLKPQPNVAAEHKINFVPMKTQLLKTRRKVDCIICTRVVKPSIEDIFELPMNNCKVRRKIEEHRRGLNTYRRETHVVVGKTSLLLSVLKQNKTKIPQKCCDHSLLSFNI